ncbi:MAG: glycosyl hydrolase family 31 [Spirochaetes bacterium]|nr:MAG: glycosyl hydrolase family 31 [Spirochaetota bacterium]
MAEKIVHQPLGLENPYYQEPTERFPRYPEEGQEVLLGVAVRDVNPGIKVWATWRSDAGTSGKSSQGKWRENKNGFSYWFVPLPAFKRGRKITYKVHALCGEKEVISKEYSFSVSGWTMGGELLHHRNVAGILELNCRTTTPVIPYQVLLSFVGTSCIRVRFLGGKNCNFHRPESGKKIFYRGSDRLNSYLIEENERYIIITNNKLKVVIIRNPLRIIIQDTSGREILEQSEPVQWLVSGEGDPAEVKQTFKCPQGEKFYGFGERYNGLNQRGNTLDIRVFEQYKNQEKNTYIPVPFFISSRGYGHYINSAGYTRYDLDSQTDGSWYFRTSIGSMREVESIVFTGKPLEILRNITNFVGKPVLPPSWVFGPWMSSNEWNSQKRVLEEVEKSIKFNIPVSVLVIEAWSDEKTFYIWNDARYIPKKPEQSFRYKDFTFPRDGLWPDPKGMIEKLHTMGIRVLLWQIPVMKKLSSPHKQHDRDESYMIEKGFCIQEKEGSPYRVRAPWFHQGLVLDPSNREAVRWWLSKRAYLLDEMKIDGFKTDGGEHLWGKSLICTQGYSGDELINLYPNLYIGAYHEFVRQRREGDAITFSRAGYIGAQKFPVHWAGDQDSSWEALRSILFALLNAGLSGIPFMGWDIAGFSGEIPTAELFLRASAMAVFTPIMQYHSEYNYHRLPSRDRTPWNIAERTGKPEVISIYRQLAHLRMKLLPYIEGEAQYCAETGEPLMRPLFLDWPGVPEAWDIEDEYLFGRSILVAPVLEPNHFSRSVYLPPEEWVDPWSGEELKGLEWIDRDVPIDRIPVFVRKVHYRIFERIFKNNGKKSRR